MDELFCAEGPVYPDGPIAPKDPKMLEDTRVLDNLLHLQPFSVPPQNYFRHIQRDIKPFMREVIIKWVLDVCKEQACEEQVFAVAASLLDRFLSICVVDKTQLQLLGAVCLLLGSKLRQCNYLSVDLLASYTDYSISHEEIRSWELRVISKLGWDLAPVTSFDFVDQLLSRVSCLTRHPADIRKFSTSFLTLAITVPDFMMLEPSVLAAAAIASAVQPLFIVCEWNAIVNTMAASVKVDPNTLHLIIPEIKMVAGREDVGL